MTPAFSIIIPAYNEENRIGGLLAQMEGSSGDYLVVCDGSDSTPEIIRQFAEVHPELTLRCLTYPERLGKGGAVREGFLHASAPLVGFMDADGSTSIAQMQALFAVLDGADCVIGSRWLPGSVVPTRQGITRRIESRGFNILIRSLFSLSLSDTQCGAKVFKKSAIDAVIGDMISTGFEFDVELLWRLSKKGLSIREYPITWHNQEESRVRRTDIFRMLTRLIALRFSGVT
ncbi:MAG: dolichyl-phosphate beta-glucosyltransferase [Methanoregulaceae archaeon]